MAITRGQMQRELYGIGSYFPPENGREKFGFGSFIKKTIRKIIPNEVSKVAVKAAPIVAPFNPAVAAGMAAIGGFDQTGRIGQSVKSGLITYGLGQGARYLGGAGFQQNPFTSGGAFTSGGFMSGFSSPLGTQTGIGKMLADKGYIKAATPTQEISLGTGDATAAETFYAGDPATAASRDFAAGTGQFGDTYYTLSPAEQAAQAADIAQAQTSLGSSYLPAQEVTFKQSAGQLVDAIKTGDLGQLGQSLKNLGGKAVKAIYTKPIPGEPGKTQIDKFAIAATIAGGASYLEAKQLAEEAELVEDADDYTEEMYQADKQRFMDQYAKDLPEEAFGITAKADGGRVGFAFGSQPESREGITSITLTKEDEEDSNQQVADLSKNRLTQLLGLLESPNLDDDYRKTIQDEIDQILNSFATGGRVQYSDGSDFKKMKSPVISINPLDDAMNKSAGLDEELEGPGGLGALGLMQLMKKGAPSFSSAEKTLVIRNLAGRGKGTSAYKELGKTIPEAKKIMDNPAANLKDAVILKEFIKTLMSKKDGGIINTRQAYAMGSEVPLRQNQQGVTEMDFRETGGFVPPIGIKEKADDIPAMLSNNEFVFTADAVRAAGGGSVNKGAQKMYALMKQLEGKA